MMKYQNILKEKIIPKICEDYANNDEDKQILKNVDSAFKLVT